MGNRTRYQDQFRNRERDWRNRNQDNEDYDDDRNGNRFNDAGNFSSNYGQGQYGGSYSSGWNDDRRNDDYNEYNRQGRSNDMNRNYGGNDFRSGSSRPYGSGEYGRSFDSRGYEDRGYGEYNRNDRNMNRDRDWWDRTTDEVSSWFGDEDAERRRRMDKMNGPHRGKGPKGYTRSDDKIRDDINDKLYHDSYVDAGDIEVTVSNGEVTLTGTVDSRDTKHRAEDLAEEVTGVNNVSNNLKVNKTSSSWGTSQSDMSKGGTSKSGSSKDISESYRRN